MKLREETKSKKWELVNKEHNIGEINQNSQYNNEKYLTGLERNGSVLEQKDEGLQKR